MRRQFAFLPDVVEPSATGRSRSGNAARTRRPYGPVMNFGAPEILIVLAVFVLFFGASRLPGLARSVGEAQRELKRGAAGEPSES
jgi:sec-independent protein translocase protein TatA